MHHFRHGNTGVINQHIHRAEGLLGGIKGGGDTVDLSDVHGHCHGFATAGCDVANQCLQLVFTACANHHFGAGCRENAGKVIAKAAGRAGNQGGLAR